MMNESLAYFIPKRGRRPHRLRQLERRTKAFMLQNNENYSLFGKRFSESRIFIRNESPFNNVTMAVFLDGPLYWAALVHCEDLLPTPSLQLHLWVSKQSLLPCYPSTCRNVQISSLEELVSRQTELMATSNASQQAAEAARQAAHDQLGVGQGELAEARRGLEAVRQQAELASERAARDVAELRGRLAGLEVERQEAIKRTDELERRLRDKEAEVCNLSLVYMVLFMLSESVVF
ncbi:unnamed protein product [Protopolystoma xenopodis]|uniref:Uncharacterized protein n=1 Tax=Protopolystoma xenopodis TaxID=117903 RepID=A0A3S5AGP1_9PLAT|nr:unnamed protein product [Protopolystoma xenopodis]